MVHPSRSVVGESVALERINRAVYVDETEARKLGEIARQYNTLARTGELTTPVVGTFIADYRVEQGTRGPPQDRHLEPMDKMKSRALRESEGRSVLDVLMRVEAYHHGEYGALAPVRYLYARQIQRMNQQRAYAWATQRALRRHPSKPYPQSLITAKVHVRRHLKHPPRSCLCHRSKAVDHVRRGMARRLS